MVSNYFTKGYDIAFEYEDKNLQTKRYEITLSLILATLRGFCLFIIGDFIEYRQKKPLKSNFISVHNLN